MVSGKSLTVTSSAATNTGFQWNTPASISQSSTNDILIINGGGTAANNVWGNGSIGVTSTQGNVYINGYTTLQITGSASTLGDNLIIGQDGNGASTVEFYNQTATLQVNNSAYIQAADDTNDGPGPNQILFDTDLVHTGGTISKGLGLASPSTTDSFIDNYGAITRNNPGMFQIDLPIKNEASSDGSTTHGELDLQSDLWVSGQSSNKTANYSVDQVGGETILDHSGTNTGGLKTLAGFRMDAGQLLTYGGGDASIGITNAHAIALNITGGTVDISADDHTQYGSLLTGKTSWTGGTFDAYVNGSDNTKQTQLVTGDATLGAGADLNVTALGDDPQQLTWTVVSANTITNTLTFDSAALFDINYAGTPTSSIQVTWDPS